MKCSICKYARVKIKIANGKINPVKSYCKYGRWIYYNSDVPDMVCEYFKLDDDCSIIDVFYKIIEQIEGSIGAIK